MFLQPDTTETHLLGGKGTALARLGALGFDVPPWFAIPADTDFTPSELQSHTEALGSGSFAVRSPRCSRSGSRSRFSPPPWMS